MQNYLKNRFFYFNQIKLKPRLLSVFRFNSTKKLVPFANDGAASEDNSSDFQEKKQKVIKVAIIGAPNAGKSSFINTFTSHRICPTSRKVHTTRTQSQTIYTKRNVQMVMFDTPGLTTIQENKKYDLGDSFLRECNNSIKNSDMIAVIHDVSNSYTRNVLHPTVLETLIAHQTIPSILILNKIDMVKAKRILLDLVRILTEGTLTCKQRRYIPWKGQEEKFLQDMQRPVKYKNEKPAGWPYFSEVFMVSSLTGDGFKEINHHLSGQSLEKTWEFPDYQFTDQKPEDMIIENVRATLLDFLPEEVPYQLRCEMEYFEVKEGQLHAHVNIHCKTKRLEHLISGSQNSRLKQISEMVVSNIIQLYNIKTTITLNVISKLGPPKRMPQLIGAPNNITQQQRKNKNKGNNFSNKRKNPQNKHF